MAAKSKERAKVSGKAKAKNSGETKREAVNPFKTKKSKESPQVSNDTITPPPDVSAIAL